MPETETQNINPPDIVLGPPPEQMKEFHFLIGSWSARRKSYSPEGTLLADHPGRLTARYINDGRMIFDDFTKFTEDGEVISYATTVRTFCVETNRWEMQFMFSLQHVHTQSFRGQFIDGEGHFDAIVSATPENAIMAKVRFYDIQKDSFEWSISNTNDGGKTWLIEGRISAKRES